MARSRACGFLRVLAIVDPPTTLQAVPGSAAGHELPHPTSTYARECQGMESGFSLGQINQVLRYAFFLEDARDHFPIAPGTNQRPFKGAFAPAGKVIDVACHVVIDEQRQI